MTTEQQILDLNELAAIGKAHGRSLFDCNINGMDITDAMDYDDLQDTVHCYCAEADENYRCYSPFEFFCKELNDAENSEEAWQAYEDGISEGVQEAFDEWFRYRRPELFDNDSEVSNDE